MTVEPRLQIWTGSGGLYIAERINNLLILLGPVSSCVVDSVLLASGGMIFVMSFYELILNDEVIYIRTT